MGVQLSDTEIADFLAHGHTLVLSTIRKSGEPFVVPLWYVWRDGAFYVVVFRDSPKVAHVRRDPRACCMVEEGSQWVDLKAVVANCDVTIHEDPAFVAEINAASEHKYRDYSKEMASLPKAALDHYARGRIVLELRPRPGELRSWYNRKIRMATNGNS